jgi:hypothetical protein
MKQGLIVGIAASAVLIGLQLNQAKAPVEFAGLTIISTMSLSMAGGWFGGQLLPPIFKRKREVSPAW